MIAWSDDAPEALTAQELQVYRALRADAEQDNALVAALRRESDRNLVLSLAVAVLSVAVGVLVFVLIRG